MLWTEFDFNSRLLMLDVKFSAPVSSCGLIRVIAITLLLNVCFQRPPNFLLIP